MDSTNENTQVIVSQLTRDADRTITRNVDWFTPETERNLVAETLISMIAMPLLMEFLKGLVGDTEKSLFAAVSNYIKKRHEAQPPERPTAQELETAVASASALAQETPPADFQKKIDMVTASLQETLQTLMPEDVAAEIADDYRASLVKNLIPA